MGEGEVLSLGWGFGYRVEGLDLEGSGRAEMAAEATAAGLTWEEPIPAPDMVGWPNSFLFFSADAMNCILHICVGLWP